MLPGPSRYLARRETVVLEVHRHFMALFRPFAVAVGAVMVASALGATMGADARGRPSETLLGLVAVFFVVRFLWKWLEWQVDRLVVTDQRIFEVSGVLTRKVASMPLSKLTDMTYRRSPWGRLFGYGELIVETAGQTQALSNIRFVPRPDSFYRTVTSLVTARAAPPERYRPEPAPPDDEDTGPIEPAIL